MGEFWVHDLSNLLAMLVYLECAFDIFDRLIGKKLGNTMKHNEERVLFDTIVDIYQDQEENPLIPSYVLQSS